ncbi:MAG: hypothetical protein EOO19_07445 [Chryseobacterium sp.]|nr:MAG: hypothetical protein EOO19_07445 [Chryseobacterium sp.]
MKKYLLTSLITISGLITLAQNSKSKSERISFSTHETNTSHNLNASFPIERAERVYAAFVAALGTAKQSSANGSSWAEDNYTASVTPTGFRADLDKEKASAKEIAMFKQLTASLHQALGQPKPPKTPKD